MFQGLRTAVYRAEDVAKAKQWYSEMLGITPYFDQPFYVGFNVGGYELGLDPNASPAIRGNAYWGVANIEEAWKKLLSLGATENNPIHDVGDEIKVASVNDPFGNVLCIIENPHFKLG